MIERIRRLINLRKLISVEERIAELEKREMKMQEHLRNHSDALSRHGIALRNHRTTLKNQRDMLQKQGTNHGIALHNHRTTLKNQRDMLQKQDTNLHGQLNNMQRERISPLHRRFKILDNQIKDLEEQVDLLKSSLEVPQELVEEFLEWRTRTPVPENPLVTVAVATYNRARLLTERCIPSILGQTYDNLELIVVGDGCTDETEEMLAEISDPRLTFINLTNKGSYPADPIRRWMVAGTPAMNKAMSMARGDFVTHLDDDDEYMTDRLERLVEFCTDNNCDFVWHPVWVEDKEDNWRLMESERFARKQVTTSSVFYRSWFTKIEWDINAHLLMEPGDWNRFRRIKYIGPTITRYPEPLLKHYRQMNQS